MRNWQNELAAVGLVAVFVTSLAAGCAFWRDAEPESAFDRPAVSAGPAGSHTDVVTAPAPAAKPVKLRARRAGRPAAPPASAAAETAEAEGQAAEGLEAANAATDAGAAQEALAEAREALPPVAEDASDSRPSLILPVAVIVALGLLGVWFSSRQTSA